MSTTTTDQVAVGTACWVTTSTTLPSNFRDLSGLLAVRMEAHTHWLGLLPITPDSHADNSGWDLDSGLNETEAALVTKWKTTHRGWWIEVNEIVSVGVDEPLVLVLEEETPDQVTIQYLNRQIEQFVEQRDRARRELEDFRELVTEVCAESAEEHDMCSVYEEVMDRLGLEARRPQTFEVTARIHYTQKLTITALSQSKAADKLRETETNSWWRPSSPLTEGDSSESAWDIEVEIGEG